MTLLLFILVLIVLIVVHEFGHFVVAKWSGMRVDEFGIGYPPKIWGKKIGETEYTLNALPFGGFVKIYGEDETDADVLSSSRSFSARPRILQAATLVAGITMNLLLAYVIISGILIAGTPRALSPDEIPLAADARLMVADVIPGSPAAGAGLMTGDSIVSLAASDDLFTSADADAFLGYVGAREVGEVIDVSILRGGEVQQLEVTPVAGIIAEDPDRIALGVSVATVGTVPVPLHRAPIEGAILTWEATKATAIGLASFLASAITLQADLTQVSGPVGIAGAVGSAYSEGFTQLLSIAAIISINLALINLLPIPALDGGRLLFVIIEGIIRRPIKPAIAATVNGIGFALLILLMVVVTFSDILKLVA